MNIEKEKKSLGDYFDDLLAALIRSIGMILSYVGIPGLTLILVFYFIEKHASDQQTKEIIDYYFLFKNKNTYFLVFFWETVFFIFLLLIQHNYYRRKDKLQQQRITDLEKTNEKLQNVILKNKNRK